MNRHWIPRYSAAHRENFIRQYPMAYKDGHYSPPLLPRVTTANGLTLAICNFLNWSGHRATRIAASGRLIDGTQKMESGVYIKTRKYIKGSTRKGSSDISATINGRSVMIEVKIGSDKPSPDQLKEQAKERAAQGIYEFIKTIDEFFNLYDQINHEK